MMTPLDSLPAAQFRARFREFLDTQYAEEWRHTPQRPFLRLRGAEAVQWLRLLHAGGWRAPAWPRDHGGLGLSFAKQVIYREELERRGVARLLDLADNLVGPIIIQFGTEEQRKHYLPRALDCRDIWCQGYSEPNAGSDLASLRTTAVMSDEHFVVNGQKTWTTHASEATHIFLLVRTNKLAVKQAGISFLLVDLNSPGISIRPIVNLVGEEEFCEVFFTDVKVPRANLVGEIDQGWKIAKALLGHERIFLGSPALAARTLKVAELAVDATGQWHDAAVSDRYASLALDLHDLEALYAQACDATAAGRPLGPDVSAMKIVASELVQRITEFTLEIGGDHGGVSGGVDFDGLQIDFHWQFMMARPMTIYGGTSEIQRNIIAKTVLGLPTGA